MIPRQEITNIQEDKLPSGGSVEWPLVAIAYTWAMLRISIPGGQVYPIRVSYNGMQVRVRLDSHDEAAISLLPFIRADVYASGGVSAPFPFDDTDLTAANRMRGVLHLTVSDDDGDTTVDVPYIFGACDPRDEVTDVYWDYDPNADNWGSYESVAAWVNYKPVTHYNNYVNIAAYVSGQPVIDFATPLDSVNYYGDKIVFSTINYHIRYDRRTANFLRLRWLDEHGDINERKFTLAARSYTGAKGDSWHVAHDENVIDANNVYAGRDQFFAIEAGESVTVGDDAVPIEFYDTVKTLATAPVVMAWMGGFWRKVYATATIECDPRKTTFSVTATVTVPTPAIMEF